MKKAKRVIVAATVMASLVTATPVMAFKWEIGQKEEITETAQIEPATEEETEAVFFCMQGFMGRFAAKNL